MHAQAEKSNGEVSSGRIQHEDDISHSPSLIKDNRKQGPGFVDNRAQVKKTDQSATSKNKNNFAQKPHPILNKKNKKKEVTKPQDKKPFAKTTKTTVNKITPSVANKAAPKTNVSAKTAASSSKVSAAPAAHQKGEVDTEDSEPEGEPIEAFQTFFSKSASEISAQSFNYGDSMNTSFGVNRKSLDKTTPPIRAVMDQNKDQNSVKKATASKQPLPRQEQWNRPVTHSVPKAPSFNPEVNSNPQNISAKQHGIALQSHSAQSDFASGIQDMPGQERVVGSNMEAKAHVVLPSSPNVGQPATNDAMVDYLNKPIPNNVRTMVDMALKPTLKQSFSEPTSSLENATKHRDAVHQSSVEKMEVQSKALQKKANVDQGHELTKSKQAIETHKENSMQESRTMLGSFQSKLGGAQSASYQKINGKINTANQTASQHVESAHQQAVAKQNEANQKVAQQHAAAAQKRSHMSFWDRIKGAFSSIFNAIANAINSIVSAVASVISAIVSVANKLATGIIDGCTRFVEAEIKVFAALAKTLVNTLLVAFPGIRNKLDALIDNVVNKVDAAINKIANTLKASINKLANTLKEIVAFAANYVETMALAASEIASAVLSGDFSAIPKIAFVMACKSIGLPGEQFYEILSKAGSQILDIIKHPEKFLKNLIKAGKKGFGKFFKNIKKHIKNGLMGWLFGQVAESGITIPKSFTKVSVFTLIRQSLGLTFEYVKQKAISIIGEKNAERLEIVIGYLKTLFTKGPMAIYNEFKEKYETMKPGLLEMVENWAITKIIQKGIIKVSSMLIPGSGFVQSIYGMWQTLQFFRKNIKHIMSVVNSMMNSIAQINQGNIGAAANYVEKTLVKTLPLVFAWMAKMIGLGGVGAKVKQMMGKLRAPVDKAVTGVIHGIMKLGKAAFGKIKAGAGKLKGKLVGGKKKKKDLAKKQLIAAIDEKGGMTKAEIKSELTRLKSSQGLSEATFETENSGKEGSVSLDSAKGKKSGDKSTEDEIELVAVNEDGETVQRKENGHSKNKMNVKLNSSSGTKSKLPEKLKQGMEQHTGMSLEHVNVHYNSSEPKKVNAHAYAQGSDIHISSGQEKHLPHELGHVVQQMKGLVQGTTKVGGNNVNDSSKLEEEATEMGEAAIRNEVIGFSENVVKPKTVQKMKMDNLQVKKIGAIKTDQVIQAKTDIEHTVGYVNLYNFKKDKKETKHKVGKEMKAKLDTADPVIGRATGAQWTWMKALRKTYSSAGVIRGHLLNHDLGGFGIEANLYPISTKANGAHSKTVEQNVKGLLNEEYKKVDTGLRKRIVYNVTVRETEDHDPENAKFDCEYGIEGESLTAVPIESKLKGKGDAYSGQSPSIAHKDWSHKKNGKDRRGEMDEEDKKIYTDSTNPKIKFKVPADLDEKTLEPKVDTAGGFTGAKSATFVKVTVLNEISTLLQNWKVTEDQSTKVQEFMKENAEFQDNLQDPDEAKRLVIKYLMTVLKLKPPPKTDREERYDRRKRDRDD